MQITHCYYVGHYEGNVKLLIFFVSDVERKYVKTAKEQAGDKYRIYDFEVRAYYDTKKDKLQCTFVYVLNAENVIQFDYKFKRVQKQEIHARVLKELKKVRI
jgi:hypothetical protein